MTRGFRTAAHRFGLAALIMLRSVTSVLPAVALALVVGAGSTLLAQWSRYSSGNVPKGADGKPDLTAPAPRTADGKPDLSGVWETVPCIDCADRNRGSSGAGALPAAGGPGAGNAPPAGRGAAGAPAAGRGQAGGFIFGNVGAQLPDGAPPYQPWAAELVKKRMADDSKDNPDAHCLPMGIMQLTTHPFPRKIIQTPAEVLVIYEGSGTTVRELFLDGRRPEKDADPWWNGYSTGRWEGDTLVVETTGFMDDGWLDVRGSPLTSAGKVTERFRRINFGYLEIEVTIDDPKAYTRPFTVKVSNRIMVDTQLIEFVCIDKDAQHYLGGTAK
jgi:hypothetical protein